MRRLLSAIFVAALPAFAPPLGAATPQGASPHGPSPAAISAEDVERDWRRQEEVRGIDWSPTAILRRGLQLAESLRPLGADVEAAIRRLRPYEARLATLPAEAAERDALMRALRWEVRRLALAHPRLDFSKLLFVRRAPGSYPHMCDQYFGWFAQPGGGLYVLENFPALPGGCAEATGARPRLRCLSESLPTGSVLGADLSYDGRRVLFAHARFYPGLADLPDKTDKSQIPEDAFYHLYEADLDGGRLTRLTRGKFDHFDGRYLPDGQIVLLSTRRGATVRACSLLDAERADEESARPDGFMRCGGSPRRPVAIYTLHVMDAARRTIRPISAFENFEWSPSVADDGRILYARWDYVDRHFLPFISLWSTLPDGTAARAVFGNYTINPVAMFEPRSIPGSPRLIFTAAAQHSLTGGSLVLLDPRRGTDGEAPMERITPEVGFPESEGWPCSYYATPWPLTEDHYLVAWSDRPLRSEDERYERPNPVDALGVYLYDRFGNLELLHRDAELSSLSPVPVRPRPLPPAIWSQLPPRPALLPDRSAAAEKAEVATGRLLVADVYEGLAGIERGAVERLRVVGIPPKTQPTMNRPPLGLTRDDPGKFVLGTAPVEADGSAHFHVPAGVSLMLQALDAEGRAVQTMRSAIYVQPGETLACIGCHEARSAAPPPRPALAALREPSPLRPGPEGSWPLDYRRLVQPVLDRHCTECHSPRGNAAGFDLTPAQSYGNLIAYGRNNLFKLVDERYDEGRSIVGQGPAATNELLPLLDAGHEGVQLTAEERDRLVTWMDTYAQRLGHFSREQEEELLRLREALAPILDPPGENP